MSGRKRDEGKTDWSVAFVGAGLALEQVARALAFGASKYADPDGANWRALENGDRRYFSAAVRHLVAGVRGEESDAESGLHPYAHAAACVVMLLDRYLCRPSSVTAHRSKPPATRPPDE